MKGKSLLNSGLGAAIVRACAVIMALLCPCVIAADTAAGGPQRLAILSSKEIRESGLNDLLTVRLQELPDIELVERDLLRRVLDEVTLSMMLGADQSENRRDAGALLKADMLVLLSLEKAEDKRNVTVVISDSSNGARLHIGEVPFDSGNLENTCGDVARIVNDTLERFRAGVKQIIGMSYFASKNLVHDYDHLQAGYANLLGNALSSLPGIAVIEIEEARSIRHESELAGDMQTNRVVPLFVEGEFTVQESGTKKQAKVHMTIRISNRAGVMKQIERKDLNIDKVAEFITNDIAQEILRLSKSKWFKKFNKEKQFQRLVDKAAEFARVGDWERSIGLLEAAVLLKPDSVEQRVRLIDEYCRIDKAKYGLDHLEYMVSNRLINVVYALQLSNKCLSNLSSVFHIFLSAIPSPDLPVEAELLKKDFLRNVYPQILKLIPSAEDPVGQRKGYKRWYDLLIKHVLLRRDGGRLTEYHDKEDLELLLYLHINAVPEEVSPSSEFIEFLKKHARPGWRRSKWARGKVGYFTEKDFVDFVKAMGHSKKTLTSFYGRYALLYHEYHKRRKQGVAMNDLRDEAQLLIDEIKKHKILGRLVGETKKLFEKIEQCIQKEET